MQYSLVEFIKTKEIEVVPCSWVRGSKCLWPNRPSSKVAQMAKKGYPPGTDCTEYTVRVKGIFVSYHAARLKLPLFEMTSDINSDVPAKRKRIAKVIESEDEDFPPVPPTFLHTNQDPTRRQAQHASSATRASNDTEEQSSFRSQVSDASSDTGMPASCSGSFAAPSPLSAADTDDISTLRSENVLCPSRSAEERPMPLREFQRQVLRMLNIIRLNQQEQGDLLSGFLCSRPDTLVTEETLIFPEPLDTVEQLEEFESGLTPETEKKLVIELARLGGSSSKMAVKRMLHHLLTNNLGMLYSWLGNKGKERFKDLKIVNIMLRAVRQIKRLEKTTEFDVETEVKSWLRHAKDRQSRLQKV
ncbi:uncharacterized protein LOC135374412 [Ornithodoros turicata]|uniref:uncharacterized protein LOC135374412 n=1 Tax=Ornithodoros turicata TaxID=34597 RepID=UPI00313994AD